MGFMCSSDCVLKLGLCCVLVLWLQLCARVGAMLCSCFVAPIVC